MEILSLYGILKLNKSIFPSFGTNGMGIFTVYVLRSLKSGKRYVGFTTKNPAERLAEHNLGSNKWTSVNRPFIMLGKEVFDSKVAAIKRERFLKSGQGRRYLDGEFGH